MQSDANPFTAGGALPQDAPSYVHRAADLQLLEALLARKFCYLLDSRQVGKSSLLIRTATELRLRDTRVAWIDISGLGAQVTPEQWYAGMAFQLAEPLGLSAIAESIWAKRATLSPVLRWAKVVEAIVSESDSPPLCLFIDEIDAVRTLPFSTDEFFASLRVLYQERHLKPALQKLTVCLSGAASPLTLIDDVRTTPFNIGQRIELTDFSFQEARSLSGLLPVPRLLERVLYWTEGQPYLTQRLCSAIVSSGASSVSEVDRECRERFLSRSARESEVHLAFAADRVRRGDSDLVPTLLLLRTAQSPGGAPFAPSDPCAETLRLAGLVRLDKGRLHMRNRIVAQVFDRKWITDSLPDAEVRRQKQALRRGFLRATALYATLGILGSVAWWGMSRARSAERDALDSRTTAKKLDRRVQDLLGSVSSLETRQQQLSRDNATAARSLSQAGTKNRQLQAKANRLHNASTLALAQAASAQQKAQQESTRAKRAQEAGQSAREALQATRSSLGRLERRVAEVEAALRPEAVDSLAHLARQWKANPQDLALARALRTTLLHGVQKRLRFAIPFDCYSAGYRPDGKVLGVGGNDGNVILLDAQTGRMLARGRAKQLAGMQLPPEERRVNSVGYLPNGTLITAHQDGRIHLWARRGKELYEQSVFSPRRPGEKESIGIVLAEPLPGGKYAAMTAPGNRIRLVRLVDGAVEDLPERFESPVACIAVREQDTPTGRTTVLAAGDQQGYLRLWDLNQRLALRQSNVYRDAELGTSVENANRIGLSGARFGEDTLLLVGDRPGTMTYVTGTGDLHRRYFGAPSFQFSGDISLDDRMVASGGTDGVLRIWSRNSPSTQLTPLYALGNFPDAIAEVRWRPGKREIVAVSVRGIVEIWTLTDDALFNVGGTPYALTVSPNGQWAAIGGSDKLLCSWALTGAPDTRSIPGPKEIRSISFSHDGKIIATGGKNGWVRVDERKSLVMTPQRVLPTRANSTEEGHSTNTDVIRSVFSRDNKQLVTVDTAGIILTWDTANWRERGRLDLKLTRDQECITAEFTPDGQYLALSIRTRRSTWGAGEVRLIRLHEFSASQVGIISQSRFATAVAFSQNGSLLAIGGGDQKIAIWDWNTRKQKTQFRADGRGITCLAFTSDSHTLAVGAESGEITLWKLPRPGLNPESMLLTRYTSAVTALRFLPSDNELLAATSEGSWRQLPVSPQEVWKRVQKVLAAR